MIPLGLHTNIYPLIAGACKLRQASMARGDDVCCVCAMELTMLSASPLLLSCSYPFTASSLRTHTMLCAPSTRFDLFHFYFCEITFINLQKYITTWTRLNASAVQGGGMINKWKAV